VRLLPQVKKMKHVFNKKKLLKIYSKLGIDVKNNKILFDLLNKLDSSCEKFNQQIELFHMDFLLGLSEIQDFDEKSFNKYIDKINATKGKLNFWGEKFEVFIYSRLIKGNPEIITNLKRGTDGIEPDLIFNFNNSPLGLELTTLKFLNLPKSKKNILSKITNKILEKNNKPYSNEKTALLIDITNIVAYEKILNLDLNKIFKEYFNGFGYLDKEVNFGIIILCNSVFKYKQDGTLKHRLEPRIGFISETKSIDNNLKKFINILFDNFKPNDDFDLKFHHLNI